MLETPFPQHTALPGYARAFQASMHARWVWTQTKRALCAVLKSEPSHRELEAIR